MPKISVIVPVYNVEKYLNKCLNSIVNQTLTDIEIIIVNDGSPDNSEKIIKLYQKKYSNIKYYLKNNGGLSSARNFGITKSSGEYISFIDSDDYIDKNMLELMYNKATNGNFDVVVTNLKYIYDNYSKDVSSNLKKDVTDINGIKKAMLNLYPAACNKIYKREIFDSIKFKDGVWYEDVEFMYKLFSIISSIGVVNDNSYNYLQRENAITSTFNDKIFDYINNWNGIIQFYKDKKLFNNFQKELEYSYVRYIYATMIKGMLNFNEYNKYKKGVELAIKNVSNQFPNYRENIYFYSSLKGIYLLVFNKHIARIIYKLKKAKKLK